MSKNKVAFKVGTPAYRNTWKNKNGHIRTNLYVTHQRALASAVTSQGCLFQEVAVPIYPSMCLTRPQEF